MAKHDWQWVGQEERVYFGNQDKPYAVDIYKCRSCEKTVATKGHKEPTPERCLAAAGER